MVNLSVYFIRGEFLKYIKMSEWVSALLFPHHTQHHQIFYSLVFCYVFYIFFSFKIISTFFVFISKKMLFFLQKLLLFYHIFKFNCYFCLVFFLFLNAVDNFDLLVLKDLIFFFLVFCWRRAIASKNNNLTRLTYKLYEIRKKRF